MTQYLGICMVVVVIGLVLSITSRIVTRSILEEMEASRKRRNAKLWEEIDKTINHFKPELERTLNNLNKKMEETKTKKTEDDVDWSKIDIDIKD